MVHSSVLLDPASYKLCESTLWINKARTHWVRSGRSDYEHNWDILRNILEPTIWEHLGTSIRSFLAPAFELIGYMQILLIVSISVSIAMYCLIQFYLSIADRIRQYRPILQLFSIKAIIFLMFWQYTFLSSLHSFDVIKDTKYMTAEDINVGIAAILQTFEMMLFSFLHLKCFSYIPYRKQNRDEMTPKGKALKHALDFSDFWRETRDGAVYMWRKMRGQEAELEARRRTHFEQAMGKKRTLTERVKRESPAEPHTLVSDGDSEELEIPQSKLLLRREYLQSKPKAKAKGKERLLPLHGDEERMVEHERQHSWWSRMVGRFSSHSDEELRLSSSAVRSQPPLRSGKSQVREYARQQVDLDEPPPPSLLGRGKKTGNIWAEKQPFLNWSPSVTPLPQLDEKGPREDTARALTHGEEFRRSGKIEDKKSIHHRDDSLLARIFSRSPELGSDEEEEKKEKYLKLPSLFQRKQDVAKEVKGWDIPLSKSPLAPRESSNSVPMVPTPSRVSSTPIRLKEDLPSIPSLSPSPPSRANQHLNNLLCTPPPAPAQPTPVLHESLSRKPDLLVADEKGSISSTEITPLKPEERTRKWVADTNNELGSSLRRMFSRAPPTIAPTGVPLAPPSFGTKGPRKPKKIVMPAPLSPARWPEGISAQAPRSYIPITHVSRLPPGAGFGSQSRPESHPFAPEQVYGSPPAAPGQIYGSPLSHSRRMGELPLQAIGQHGFNPYEHFGVPALPPQSPETSGSRHSRARERHHHRAQESDSPRTSQPHSSYGMDFPLDTGPLPRHPVLRQETARRRRQSQPLPGLPPGAVPPSNAPEGAKRPKRLSEPVRSSVACNADKPNSSTSPAAQLLSSLVPTSPVSSLGDSRYPRATSRENYFDPYDTVSPYLTNIMNDSVPPTVPLGIPVSSPESASRRNKRR